MGCAVKASKGPICVYQANDEGYTALLPASVVDEGGEDELGMLVCWSNCRDGNKDDREGNERGP